MARDGRARHAPSSPPNHCLFREKVPVCLSPPSTGVVFLNCSILGKETNAHSIASEYEIPMLKMLFYERREEREVGRGYR